MFQALFLKDGFSVFNQPLGTTWQAMTTHIYKFVTWPEMPHLYPLGSIFLFLPFGALAPTRFGPVLIYKLEIALFLVFAHICLYFFLKSFLKKIYICFWKTCRSLHHLCFLVIYAADGMFDSVAIHVFSFCLNDVFESERYDYFFLLVGVSVFFKYQAGIFLFPLIIVGLLSFSRKTSWTVLLRNKAVITWHTLLVIMRFYCLFECAFLVDNWTRVDYEWYQRFFI